MRAAVERHNDDGSVDVLVAVRVKVTNSETADQEQGYRLRVQDGARRGHVQDRPAGSGQFVTAVLDATPETAAVDTAPEPPTASWLARAGAFSVDVLLGVAVIATMALLTLSAPQRGWLWWVFTGAAVLVFVLIAVNRLLLPTITGWSLGRALFGIAVQETRRFARRTCAAWSLRDLAHLLDTAALFIGWLWPLWDRRRPHVRRSAAAHRGAQGRPAAARCAPAGRGGAHCGDAAVRGGRRSELSGGVPARPGGRRGPRTDRVGRTADRRTDAELRRRHAAAGLLPRPVADDRRLPRRS